LKNAKASVSTPHPQVKAGIIRKKIGNTIYRVSVHYSGTSKETLNDKILRLATNDLTFTGICGTLSVPQTGRLLEGGSLS